MKFRKKPVVVDAYQYQFPEDLTTLLPFLKGCKWRVDDDGLAIVTLEGEMVVSPGDWIIKGIAGEFYPCKPDIFQSTYEKGEDA